MPFVINRIPSEEFGITVCSVGILTRTGTHLKLIQSCHNCNRQVADHFHPQIGGGHFFFFGLRPDTPPPTLGSGSTSRYPLEQNARPALTPQMTCSGRQLNPSVTHYSMPKERKCLRKGFVNASGICDGAFSQRSGTFRPYSL